MTNEKYIPPEARQTERVLEGAEREKFIQATLDFIIGLEEALVNPDLEDELRADLTEQLADLKDSLEAMQQEGGEIKV